MVSSSPDAEGEVAPIAGQCKHTKEREKGNDEGRGGASKDKHRLERSSRSLWTRYIKRPGRVGRGRKECDTLELLTVAAVPMVDKKCTLSAVEIIRPDHTVGDMMRGFLAL
jgi:hypothetical protein